MDLVVIDNEDKKRNTTGDWPNRCNQLLWNCKNPDCDYRYTSRDDKFCLECDWPRQYCAGYPIAGRTRCRFHGGKTLIGADSPSYKGRGLSKSLPTRLFEQYNRSLNDADVLNMTPEIALLEARLTDLLSKVSDQPGFELWNKVKTAYAKFRSASREAEVRKALFELDRVITAGYIEASTWAEIKSLIEQLRKLKHTEKERRKDAETIITEHQFRTIMGYIINSIQTRVKDKDTKMALMADITLLARPNKDSDG